VQIIVLTILGSETNNELRYFRVFSAISWHFDIRPIVLQTVLMNYTIRCVISQKAFVH